MRRYSRQEEAPIVQSYLDLKAKPLASSRVNGSNAIVRNPESDLLRLPALNSTMRRSSSIASQRNTKFRLQNLDDRLQELAAEVHNTRLQTQETTLHVRNLKESLAGKEIERVREDLRKQARGLERLVHSTMTADDQRFANIKQDCGELWEQTEQLRTAVFQLRMRTEQLEQTLGFKRI